jgi:hypothetical protein
MQLLMMNTNDDEQQQQLDTSIFFDEIDIYWYFSDLITNTLTDFFRYFHKQSCAHSVICENKIRIHTYFIEMSTV